MKRSGVATAIVFFVLVPILAIVGVVGTVQPARASVFCGADVAGVIPWDVARDRELDGTPTRLYVFAIGADQGAPSSGSMIVVTEKKAYRVPFADVRFTPSPDDPKRFFSTGHMFALPDSAIVLYAWIDDATNPNTGKDATCLTIPYDVQAGLSKIVVSASAISIQGETSDRYQATPATYVQDLPPLTCGAMYTKPEVLGTPKYTDYFDTSQGRVAKPVSVRIDLGSNGHVVYVAIIKSSGSAAIDAGATDVILRGSYKPATFLCAPVSSLLYYDLDYSLQ